MNDPWFERPTEWGVVYIGPGQPDTKVEWFKTRNQRHKRVQELAKLGARVIHTTDRQVKS